MSHEWKELSKSLAEPLPRRESLQRLAVVLASLAFLVLAAADVARAQSKPRRDRDATVMTRNLYVGADLTLVTQQPSPANVEATFATVEQTDFPARADASTCSMPTSWGICPEKSLHRSAGRPITSGSSRGCDCGRSAG